MVVASPRIRFRDAQIEMAHRWPVGRIGVEVLIESAAGLRRVIQASTRASMR